MRPRAATGRIALALAVGLALGIPAAAQEPPAPTAEITLPYTIQKVWYRPGKARSFGGAKATGDLTLTLHAIEYETGKDKTSFYLPMEAVVAVSYGLVPGDVNTKWVLLRVHDGKSSRLMGFHDGAKMGFGTRTRAIYDNIRSALRQAHAGQYDVPTGFRAFDELDYMFTIGYPAEWSVYHPSATEVHDALLLGEVIYSETPVAQSGASGDGQEAESPDDVLRRIRRGETAAFSLQRDGRRDGVRCSKISGKSEERLIEQARQEGQADGDVSDVASDSVLIDGCRGVRLRWRVTPPDGKPYVVDRRVAADERATYTFTLRSTVDVVEERLALFNQAMSTFRFTDAAQP